MNRIKFKIIEPAELELDDTFEYYEYESIGLGHSFLDEFRKGVKRILAHPYAWNLIQDNVRKCVLNKFPYTIVYAIEENLIIILAIAHQHRRPDYWIDRLSDLTF
ncbi:type II toxin-antitoxin system RelE/ParE family toxin [candidate division KSB1 bacterium]|nr:type II toxin-antitoxin system RelE/ParE family toxin [candidate division KSB1 bacterium]